MSDMTRSEAIKKLKWFGEYNEEDYCGGDRIKIDGKWYYYVNKDDLKAFEMAISSLETDEAYDLMYEEPEFCENCIDREYLIKDLYCKTNGETSINIHWLEGYVKQLPSVLPKTEVCEDCVSRFEVTEILNSEYDIDKMLDRVDKLPSVLPKAKKGRWIKSNIGGAKVCSVCNAHMGLSSFKFCPNCGAKMESEDNNGSNN